MTDVITFSVTVGNIGGAVISGPVVDTLPLGLKALAGTATGGGVISADGRSVTWQVTLAPGGEPDVLRTRPRWWTLRWWMARRW